MGEGDRLIAHDLLQIVALAFGPGGVGVRRKLVMETAHKMLRERENREVIGRQANVEIHGAFDIRVRVGKLRIRNLQTEGGVEEAVGSLSAVALIVCVPGS